MKRLTCLLACMLVMGLAVSAHAELKGVEIGGSIRVRAEKFDNTAFNKNLSGDDFVSQRTRVNFTADFTDDVGGFIELQSYEVWGDDFRDDKTPGLMPNHFGGIGTFVPDDSGDVEIYQAYIEAKDVGGYPVDIKIGRQELVYGTQWLIGNDHFYGGLTFDAAKAVLKLEDYDLQVDLWVSKIADLRALEDDCDMDFYGVYGTYTGLEPLTIEAYWLFLRGAEVAGLRDLDQNTFGARVAGEYEVGPGVLDFNAEAAGQLGDARWPLAGPANFAGNVDYEAMGADIGLGYMLPDMAWMPRFGFNFTYSSGDEDPFDDEFGTFMFPFSNNHARYGLFDVLSLGNLYTFRGVVTACPVDKLTILTQYLYSFADEEVDWFAPLVGIGRTDDNVVEEIDLAAIYQYTEDLQFMVGGGVAFAHGLLSDAEYIDQSVGNNDNCYRVVAQAELTF